MKGILERDGVLHCMADTTIIPGEEPDSRLFQSVIDGRYMIEVLLVPGPLGGGRSEWTVTAITESPKRVVGRGVFVPTPTDQNHHFWATHEALRAVMDDAGIDVDAYRKTLAELRELAHKLPPNMGHIIALAILDCEQNIRQSGTLG